MEKQETNFWSEDYCILDLTFTPKENKWKIRQLNYNTLVITNNSLIIPLTIVSFSFGSLSLLIPLHLKKKSALLRPHQTCSLCSIIFFHTLLLALHRKQLGSYPSWSPLYHTPNLVVSLVVVVLAIFALFPLTSVKEGFLFYSQANPHIIWPVLGLALFINLSFFSLTL